MSLSKGLRIGAIVTLVLAAMSGQPELLMPAMFLGAGAWFTRRRGASEHELELYRRPDLINRLAEIEKRLALTEGELAAANTELDQLRAEREFDRQLLRKASEELPKPGTEGRTP